MRKPARFDLATFLAELADPLVAALETGRFSLVEGIFTVPVHLAKPRECEGRIRIQLPLRIEGRDGSSRPGRLRVEWATRTARPEGKKERRTHADE
jgi:hypothetical protein